MHRNFCGEELWEKGGGSVFFPDACNAQGLTRLIFPVRLSVSPLGESWWNFPVSFQRVPLVLGHGLVWRRAHLCSPAARASQQEFLPSGNAFGSGPHTVAMAYQSASACEGRGLLPEATWASEKTAEMLTCLLLSEYSKCSSNYMPPKKFRGLERNSLSLSHFRMSYLHLIA